MILFLVEELVKMPSERYEENLRALRAMLFGRYSRRNVRGQNRLGGHLSYEDYKAIKETGAEAIRELNEKYSGAA